MKILVADDDRDLMDVLRYLLERDGHQAVLAYDGESALRLFASESPDFVVLDLKMPKRDGMAVLGDIRQQSRVPVIILSSASDEEKIVTALQHGADDYVVKPFHPRELVARVEAIARRRDSSPSLQQGTLRLGAFSLDTNRREIRVGERPVHLTRIEFDILHYLALNRNRVIQPSELVAKIWGYDNEASEDVVKVNISRIRHKLESNPADPLYIVTVHGVGYMFRVEDR